MPEFIYYDFMLRAFAASIITATIAPILGLFMVVKRYSLMVDTLAHVSLLSVALSLLLGINLTLGTVFFTTAGGLSIERLHKYLKSYNDAILAIFLTGSLALSIIIISKAKFNISLHSLLFGSITTVSSQDLVLVTILAIIIVFVVVKTFKQLFLIAFNEDLAQATKLNTSFYNLILIGLTATAVSITIPIIGVLLIGALMIIPVLTALQFKKGFFSTMKISILFSVISTLTGLTFSFYLDIAPGATIVLIAISLFIITLFTRKTSGAKPYS